MWLAQGPQRSDAGEARTRGLSVSSQASFTEPLRSLEDTCRSVWMEGGGGGVGLVFTIHKTFCPLFISSKFWAIH